jgi:CDGSH-type Zn-finger protein/uncharacterized Fe-S cluster protein YjdI
MGEKEHVYRSDAITVRYNLKRCIHAAECVRGLPRVFDTRRRPWVEPDAAAADEVAGVVMRCPTGALHFERHDGVAAEPVPTHNTVTVTAEGPLYVRGDIELLGPDGAVIGHDTRVALCRCGASGNKPYCDNSHLRVGFDDAGALTDGSAMEGPAAGPGALRVTAAVDGPLLIEGAVELRGSDGSAVTVTKPLELCRCGASARKPLCDGSHRRISFRAD